MSTSFRTALVVALSVLATACGQSTMDIDNDELSSADETASIEGALSTSVTAGSTLATTANLNLRSSPSTTASVLRTMPIGSSVIAVTGTPNNGWYQIKHNGLTGWSSGAYLRLVSTPAGGGGGGSTGTARDAAIDRARAGVGFSYWWGHGRWLGSGVTNSTRGSCTGSCPSCSHGGTYGADCSGYVAKIWQVPSSNTALSNDSHPYSTYNFENESHGWSTISRDNAAKADALVYNSNGAGHIVLYESGGAWGDFWTYEARGCSDGIKHNLRSVTSAYKTIRRY
jgi:hypothetical protein